MNELHKAKVKAFEEMREKPNIVVEEDTEEMRKWRGSTQSEMDQCWKNLAERMEALGFHRRNERRNRTVLEEGGAEWKVAASSVHDDLLLDSQEYHE